MSNPIHRIVASAMLMLVTMGVQTSAAQTCDRACLKDMMTAYLNALVAQDPSKAPLAANVRLPRMRKNSRSAMASGSRRPRSATTGRISST